MKKQMLPLSIAFLFFIGFNHLYADEKLEEKKRNNFRENCCNCLPMIYVPVEQILYNVTNGLPETPVVRYVKFDECRKITIGKGFTVCDSVYPSRISICEPGVYRVEFNGTANSTTTLMRISLVELSNYTTSDPIPLGVLGPSELFVPGLALTVGNVVYYEFCCINKDNPPSFAIRLENLGLDITNNPTLEDFVFFGAGSGITIQRVGPCHCSSDSEDCCSCCPILLPPQPVVTRNVFPGNNGGNGGG